MIRPCCWQMGERNEQFCKHLSSQHAHAHDAARPGCGVGKGRPSFLTPHPLPPTPHPSPTPSPPNWPPEEQPHSPTHGRNKPGSPPCPWGSNDARMLPGCEGLVRTGPTTHESPGAFPRHLTVPAYVPSPSFTSRRAVEYWAKFASDSCDGFLQLRRTRLHARRAIWCARGRGRPLDAFEPCAWCRACTHAMQGTRVQRPGAPRCSIHIHSTTCGHT